MGKKAFMFPGQGSQYVGMGRDFYEKEPLFKELIDNTAKELKLDLESLMFDGPTEELIKTQNAQPALLAMSLGITKVLKQRLHLQCDAVVGHSLGEYAAYAASGRLDDSQALFLVRQRGLLMAKAGGDGKYGMAAILKLDAAVIEDILKDFVGEVVIANYNSPDQIVISGLKDRISTILNIVKEKGARAVMLPVSGAFHSPFMEPLALEFEELLKGVSFKESEIPLFTNVDAKALIKGQEILSLKAQLYSSVLFTQAITNMVNDGVDTFIEIGAGKVLSGLVKKINSNLNIINVENIEDLNKIGG
jgi:[acyl-carrier-protein] S-malonyltransferase